MQTCYLDMIKPLTPTPAKISRDGTRPSTICDVIPFYDKRCLSRRTQAEGRNSSTRAQMKEIS